MRGAARRSSRIGWLRAAVLGANDGIVSTASLLIGVAAAGAARSRRADRWPCRPRRRRDVHGGRRIRLSQLTGRHASVPTSRGAEELAKIVDAEHRELAAIYVGRGLEPRLAVRSRPAAGDQDALARTRATSSASPRRCVPVRSRRRSLPRPHSRSAPPCRSSTALLAPPAAAMIRGRLAVARFPCGPRRDRRPGRARERREGRAARHVLGRDRDGADGRDRPCLRRRRLSRPGRSRARQSGLAFADDAARRPRADRGRRGALSGRDRAVRRRSASRLRGRPTS